MKLHLESVSATILGNTVLQDITCTLAAGSCTTLLGPNGSGKSSLLRCILGLLRYSGKISLDNRDLRSLSRKELAKHLAYVPQQLPELPAYSVSEFVSLGRYAHGDRLDNEGRKKVAAALEATGCGILSKRRVNELSGGERQRVLLATALAQESAVILLDEPAAALDPEHEVALYRCFEQLRESKQQSLLIASHDINRSVLASERILGLRHGKVFFDGPAPQILQRDTLREMYGVEFSILSHPELKTDFAIPQVTCE